MTNNNTTESKKVKGLQTTNKVLVAKTKTAKEKESILSSENAILRDNLNKALDVIERLQKELGLDSKPKKSAKKKVKVDAWYNIYKGTVKKYYKGLESVRKSIEG